MESFTKDLPGKRFLFAQQKKLTNLILIIIDRNNQIVMDKTEDCIKLDPIEKIFIFWFQYPNYRWA